MLQFTIFKKNHEIPLLINFAMKVMESKNPFFHIINWHSVKLIDYPSTTDKLDFREINNCLEVSKINSDGEFEHIITIKML